MYSALMAPEYVRWLTDQEAEELIAAGVLYRCRDSTRCGYIHHAGDFLHPTPEHGTGPGLAELPGKPPITYPPLMAGECVRWLKGQEAEALIAAGAVYRCPDPARCRYGHRIGAFLHPNPEHWPGPEPAERAGDCARRPAASEADTSLPASA